MDEIQLRHLFATIAKELTESDLTRLPLKIETDHYATSEAITVVYTVIKKTVGIWEIEIKRPVDLVISNSDNDLVDKATNALGNLLKKGAELKAILTVLEFLINEKDLKIVIKDLQRMGHIDSNLESLYPYVVRPVN